jgi:hypothetical protein
LTLIHSGRGKKKIKLAIELTTAIDEIEKINNADER